MKKTVVTIVLPIYNGSKTVGRAIDSVISQTIFPSCELILINDCSRDDSSKIAQRYASKYKNIRFVDNKRNQGITKNQNLALSVSTGEYLARIDQDDRWIDERKLEKQVAFLSENHDHDLVGTWAKVVNEDGRDFELVPPTDDTTIRRKMLMASMFVSPSVMFRTNLMKRIGGYREDLRYGTEDYEYWLRIGTVGKFANLPEYCLEYSFHMSSYSVANKANAIKEHVGIIKKYKSDYPGYWFAWSKNAAQYMLLRIPFLKRVYIKLVPIVAKYIYHG